MTWGAIGKSLAVIVFLVVGGVYLIERSNAESERLNRVQDCVVKTAHIQGYAGNAYSEEAWNLFAGNCN